jgi:hypothetical protein
LAFELFRGAAPLERPQDDEHVVLVLIAVPETQQTPPSGTADTTGGTRATRRAETVPGPAAGNARAASPAELATVVAPTEEPVDWRRAARFAIHDVLATATTPARQRSFGEIPKSPFIPCEEPHDDIAWNPEPERAGISGGLPFVRLGSRCVLGLGFAGCALGELPEANGQLFAHMHDNDRPTSSVPDITGCVRKREDAIP